MPALFRPTRQALALLLSALIPLSGCATRWATQSLPPAQALKGGDADVRITLRGSLTVTLRDPAVVGDSLVGWVAPVPPDSIPQRRSYPVDEVTAVSIRKNNVGVNIGVGVLIGGALFMASILGTWAIVCSSGGCD